MIVNPEGAVWIVTCALKREKCADSVIGEFIVNVAGLSGPVNDHDPVPVHPPNTKPEAGVPRMFITFPLSLHPETGETVPPESRLIVSMYCWENVTVNVVS